MQTPEGKVKAQVKKVLAEFGAWQFWPVKTALGSRTVDCLACVDGLFIGIECKARPKACTTLQRIELEKMRAAGGHTFVAYCGDELRDYINNNLLQHRGRRDTL